MARTAPVPNIPPLPGMCPSVAVLGGGGNGGGGSGKGAGAGDGNGPGDGSGSGDEATGDSTSAAQCGQGGSTSCTSHQPGAVAGDPVDVASGRVFTTPIVDLHVAGPLPLRIARLYSSACRRRNVGMGFGWSHSLAWEIEERRTALVVHHANGTRIVVAKLEVGQQVLGPKGLLIRRTPDGFYLDADDGVHRLLQQLPGDESGSYRLTRIHDANNNALTLGYDSTGNLTTVSDSVGRQARFCWSDGAIQRLEMFLPTEQRWACFARYTVDVRGDLVLAEDSEGSRSRFVYDEAHRLTEHERPSGLVFHYVYDAQNRCVET